MGTIARPLITASQRLIALHGPLATLGLVGLALVLPLVPNAVPLFLIFTLVGLVVHHRRAFHMDLNRNALRSPWLWMLAFYVLHMVAMAWTDDLDFGWFDLQIKAPLLAVPLIAMRMPLERRKGRDDLLFIGAHALALSIGVHVVLAVWRFMIGGEFSLVHELFSARFSPFVHPSYLAMYLCVSLAAWLLTTIHTRVGRLVHHMVLVLHVVGVVLCGSKMGWMLLPAVLVAVLVLRWKDRPIRSSVLGLLGFSLIGGATLLLASPNARERVEEAWTAAFEDDVDPNAQTSSAVRRLTWSAARTLMSEAPLQGTGTGDIKNELLRVYSDEGRTWAYEHRLNAHSQYLQSAACLGYPGLVLLLLLLLLPFMSGWRQGDVLLLFFLVISAINWTVESMLEVQAGVVYFTYMALLLSWRTDAPEQRPLSGIEGGPLEQGHRRVL